MKDPIFISYSRSDGDYFANELYHFLAENGYQPWLDTKNIIPGDLWQNKSDSAIRTCWLLLFIATPESVKSPLCTAEWNRALTYKKPVVPLLYQEVLFPLFLEQRQYISFIDSNIDGFDELLKHLIFLNTPEGELHILQSRYDDLELELTRHRNPQIIKEERLKIIDQISFKKRVLADPLAQEKRIKNAIEMGIKNEHEHKSIDVSIEKFNYFRIIGNPPIGITYFFKNRDSERRNIKEYLAPDNDIKIICIYGKAGSGKTALACKVINDMENYKHNIRGITYHNKRDENLRFEQIYFACSKILGKQDEKYLIQVWKNSVTNIEIKIKTLLSYLKKHCILIFIDNFEEILTEDGCINDIEMNLFFNEFLGSYHTSQILITSREALTLPTNSQKFQKIIKLDKGLPIEHAMELLSELGKNGNLEFEKPSKSTLRAAAIKAYCFPRALEAIVSILNEDPRLSLKELLNNSTIFNNRVLENLVREAHSRLTPDSQHIIQSIAVLNCQVRYSAIMYMIEPFFKNIDVEGELGRLERTHFLNFNKKTQKYSIHPIDREYNYKLIPKDSFGGYNIYAMEQRAADYHLLIHNSPKIWSTISDLENRLQAFSHLCRAHNYDDAVLLINTIDFDFLARWGHLSLIISLRERLVNKIIDYRLQCTNYSSLCDAYRRLGQSEKSIFYGKEALEIAKNLEDNQLENTCLGNLGKTYRNIGRAQEAADYLKRAIVIAEKIEDKPNQAKHIGNLGSTYYNLGNFELSIKLLKQSIKISENFKDGPAKAGRFGHLGHPYFHLGNYKKAIELYNQALTMTRGYRARRGEGYWLWALGRAHSISGAESHGVELLNQGLVIANEIGDERLKCFLLGTLGQTHLELNDLNEALNILEIAIKIDVPELNANIASLHGIILAIIGKRDLATASLEKAIQHSNDLLSRSNNFYEAKYARAVSVATLNLLSEDDSNSILLNSEKEFLLAIKCCNSKGVIDRVIKLIKQLRKINKEVAQKILETVLFNSAINK
ncbi:MAG: TPR protein [uncultured bacterium]|nr:MAG: TPR protein [uncultured bacterium]